MKILFLNTFYRPDLRGGAERILEILVEGLAARGHDVVVLATRAGRRTSFETVGSAKVYRIGIQNIYWPTKTHLPAKPLRALWHWRDRHNRGMGYAVEDVILAETPDCINFHNLAGFSIAAWHAAIRRRIPTVQTLHDFYLMCPPTSAFKGGKACSERCLECAFFRRDHAKASARLSAVVGVSHYVLDRLLKERYFAGVCSRVIHNAQEIPSPPQRPALPLEDPLTFGYLGSLIPAKGVEWLIEQFKSLRGSARLLIAGEGAGAYKDRLQELARGHNIEFLGRVRPGEFFRMIDVAVVPSIWPEVFPGVAYEAAAHHVPVIASRVGGLPEIIHEGVNGLFCDPTDATTLGNAMRTLARDRLGLARMSHSARASVRRFLNPDRMIDEYENVMTAIVQRTIHKT